MNSFLLSKWSLYIEQNQSATIQYANETIRNASKLSKLRSAVLTPSAQQASFSPMAVVKIISLTVANSQSTGKGCGLSVAHSVKIETVKIFLKGLEAF